MFSFYTNIYSYTVPYYLSKCFKLFALVYLTLRVRKNSTMLMSSCMALVTSHSYYKVCSYLTARVFLNNNYYLAKIQFIHPKMLVFICNCTHSYKLKIPLIQYSHDCTKIYQISCEWLNYWPCMVYCLCNFTNYCQILMIWFSLYYTYF